MWFKKLKTKRSQDTVYSSASLRHAIAPLVFHYVNQVKWQNGNKNHSLGWPVTSATPDAFYCSQQCNIKMTEDKKSCPNVKVISNSVAHPPNVTVNITQCRTRHFSCATGRERELCGDFLGSQQKPRSQKKNVGLSFLSNSAKTEQTENWQTSSWKKINEAKHTGSFLPQMKYNQPPSWRDLIYGWSNSNWVFNQVCFGKRCGKVYLGKIFSEILNLSSIISPWHSLWLWVSAGSVELCVTWHVSKLTGCGMLALSNQSGLSARLSGNAKVTQVIRKEKALKNTHVAPQNVALECSQTGSLQACQPWQDLEAGSTSQSVPHTISLIPQ